jgi:hypothetical protein
MGRRGRPACYRTKNPKYPQPVVGVNYDEEYKEKVENHTWYINNTDGYYKSRINGKLVSLHHFLHGKPEKPLVTDHKNRDKLDNRSCNIRFVNHRENMSNKDKTKNSSRLTGVSWCKRNKKWRSDIKINSKSKYLGLFQTEEKASEAYQQALNNLERIK